MNTRFQLGFCLRLVGWIFLWSCGASVQLEVVQRSEVQCLFGCVLLVGAKLAWRSGDTRARAGEYRFAARSLGTPS